MRRPFRNFVSAAGLCAFSVWGAVAHADQPQKHEDVFKRLFSKPAFLALGPISSLANPEARGTIGGEVTFNRWFYEGDAGFDEIVSPGAGGFLQWEYVAGNQTRVSFGSQINYSSFGIETGYAYQTLQENRRNVHSLQIAPFISWGVAHIGLRVLAPFTSGAPLTCMMVLGLKVPINVGKKIEVRKGPPLFD